MAVALFTEPKSQAAKEHARLAGAAAAAHELVFAIRRDHQAVAVTVRDLQEELTGCFRENKPTAKTEAKLNAARASLSEPWAERIHGAEQAARQARGDADAYASEHVAELAAELHDEAAAACDRVEAALRQIIEAHAHVVDVGHRLSILARASGRDPQAVTPTTNAEEAVKGANAALTGGIRRPVLPSPREAEFVEAA